LRHINQHYATVPRIFGSVRFFSGSYMRRRAGRRMGTTGVFSSWTSAKGPVLGHTDVRFSYAALPVNAVECPRREHTVMFTICSGDKRGIAALKIHRS